ncbi:MAG: E3 binding domain-containing protein, partial [Clostridia bacterium]|nr:E3 binding domain-containing protein [Clostridia bacterium]
MAETVIMPRQGQSVESCIITEWKKKKGDAVAPGDTLFSYETDKSAFEEKAQVGGVLLAILAEEGDDVPCLEPVCVIGREGEDISALLKKETKEETSSQAPAAEIKVQAPAAPSASAEEPAVTAPAAPADGRLKISPRARKLAEKTGADPSLAIPTGPSGRIIERDINALLDRGVTAPAEEPATTAPAAPAEGPAYTDEKIPNIRKVIARQMHASLAEMAQLTLNTS